MTPIEKKSERVVVYVDGFNLYFGMLQANFEHYKWLNITQLIHSFLKPDQTLVDIKYFTSRVANNPDKQKRQTTFLEAQETTGVKIFNGRFQINDVECHRCGNIWREPNEKMTDVNIATQMLIDAYQDKYDTAILISGDSDLVPPIKAIHENFKHKRVAVFFPPSRHNNSIAAVAKGSLIIGRKKLADNQFSEEVKKKDGYILRKPHAWK